MKLSSRIGSLKPEGTWVDVIEGVRLKVLDPNTRRGAYAISSVMKLSEIQQLAEEERVDLDPTSPEAKEHREKKVKELGEKFVGDLMEFEARTTAALVIDWEGITDDDDKPLPFDQDYMRELLLLDGDFKNALSEAVIKVNEVAKEEVKKKDVVKKK